MVLIDNERFLKVTENMNNVISEESTVTEHRSNRFSSATSQIVIFGEIARLTNFANKNVHIEFWLEPSRGWFPCDGDDRSLCGLTHRCYSSTSITSVGAPFQFTIAECDMKSNESEISSGLTLYFRVVNNHSLGRSSTEAFGILKLPFRPGNFSREIKMFRPHSNRISDKLMEYFLNYSFDLDELEENHYEPLGLIYTESKGTISLNVNIIVQSSQFNPEIDESDDTHDPLWSDISQIVAAFRRARQRMIFLRMKALQLLKTQKRNNLIIYQRFIVAALVRNFCRWAKAF